jgi:uncharacterized protein YbjT (DUF2867 family)
VGGGSVVLVEVSCALQPRSQTTDFGTAPAVLASQQPQSGKVYALTGEVAWSLPELAAEAAAVSGKPTSTTR